MTESAKRPPAGLQQFQTSFSHQLRHGNAFIGATETAATVIYRKLLYNNIRGFVDRCFPVSRQILPEAQWHHLCDDFFRSARCDSPYFRDIPEQFMGFIQEQAITGVPPWLPELLHYEWMELVVEAHPGRILPSGRPVTETSTLAINPTLQNLQYQWPVHTIAPQSLPDRPTVCCLLVYRRSDHRVTFVEVTPLAAALLQIIAQQPCTLAVLTSTLRDLWPAGQAPVPQSQIREAVAGFVANEIVVEEASLASPS